jgi:AcrR family transcriptional regulator
LEARVARPSSSPRSSAKRNGKPPAPPRVNIAGLRREQIVDAAASIIATQGIQNLSLSEIEARTGMSRGQLTYYFKAKEDILLAVFDRMVQQMRERFESAESPCRHYGAEPGAWGAIQNLLAVVLDCEPPPDFIPPSDVIRQMHQLQYTFLAQTGFRDDFRQRLASLFGGWRRHMAQELSELQPLSVIDPRLLASFVQALVHGLVMQLTADPEAFDRTAMLKLCLDVLGRALRRHRPAARVHRRARRAASSDASRPEGSS